MKLLRYCLAVVLCMGCVRSFAEAAQAEAPVAAATDDKPSEATVRKRFLVAYQTAKNPAAKAGIVGMLKGLTEKQSRRLLAGMLGDHDEEVRIAACRAMSETYDADGYFVKPLMGALTDPSDFVRMAAADALGSARIKANATKALVYALITAVGTMNDSDENKRAAQVVAAYNNALERLSSRHSKSEDPRGISSFWMDYWKQNEDALRAKDVEVKGLDAEPVRPKGLQPDSFDKTDAGKNPDSKRDSEK